MKKFFTKNFDGKKQALTTNPYAMLGSIEDTIDKVSKGLIDNRELIFRLQHLRLSVKFIADGYSTMYAALEGDSQSLKKLAQAKAACYKEKTTPT